MESWQQQFFSFYFIGKLATTIIENMNGYNNEHDLHQLIKLGR